MRERGVVTPFIISHLFILHVYPAWIILLELLRISFLSWLLTVNLATSLIKPTSYLYYSLKAQFLEESLFAYLPSMRIALLFLCLLFCNQLPIYESTFRLIVQLLSLLRSLSCNMAWICSELIFYEFWFCALHSLNNISGKNKCFK